MKRGSQLNPSLVQLRYPASKIVFFIINLLIITIKIRQHVILMVSTNAGVKNWVSRPQSFKSTGRCGSERFWTWVWIESGMGFVVGFYGEVVDKRDV
jgi:hypothetical protein